MNKIEEITVKQPKNGISRTQKGVYMDDRVWERLAKRARQIDRSLNYVIEKTLKSHFNIL